MINNKKDIERIFEAYDKNKNNFIEYEELKALFLDLGLDLQFKEHDDPSRAFE